MENGPAHWARILGLLARKQGRRGARGGLVDNVVISASANRSGLGGCPDSSSGQASQARHSGSNLHKLEHGARNSRRLEEFPRWVTVPTQWIHPSPRPGDCNHFNVTVRVQVDSNLNGKSNRDDSETS